MDISALSPKIVHLNNGKLKITCDSEGNILGYLTDSSGTLLEFGILITKREIEGYAEDIKRSEEENIDIHEKFTLVTGMGYKPIIIHGTGYIEVLASPVRLAFTGVKWLEKEKPFMSNDIIVLNGNTITLTDCEPLTYVTGEGYLIIESKIRIKVCESKDLPKH